MNNELPSENNELSPAVELKTKKKAILARLPPLKLCIDSSKEIDLAGSDSEGCQESQPNIGFNNSRRPIKRQNAGKHDKKINGYFDLKAQLEAKLALRRKIGQAQRMEQYRNDNEDLFREEEEIPKSDDDTEKRKNIREEVRKKALDNEEDESDSDYQGDEESENETSYDEEDDDSVNGDKLAADSRSQSQKTESDAPIPICDESMALPSLSTPNSDLPIPTTLSQWFRDESPPREVHFPLSSFVQSTRSQPVDNDELLALCSGRFDETQRNSELTVYEEPDEVLPVKRSQNRKNELDSDDEGELTSISRRHNTNEPSEDNVDEHSGVEKQNIHHNDIGPELEDILIETEAPIRRRAILAEDMEDAENLKNIEDSIGNECGVETDYEDEDDENEEESPTNLASDIDSEDELAEFQRAERARKLKLDGFVDDQAELSGSDIGSDDEAEDGQENNEYEKEYGDDEAIDMDQVADENHKLYLKQQNDAEKREIRQLQEQLLADGDLAGIDTNRCFRFALRPDMDGDFPVEEELNAVEDDGPEDEMEQIAHARAEAIRFHLEQNVDLEQDANEEDAISYAFKTVESVVSKKNMRTASQSFSLLNMKLPIAKDNASVIKAMYTSTVTTQTTIKRPATLENTVNKKPKLVLADVLNRLD